MNTVNEFNSSANICIA